MIRNMVVAFVIIFLFAFGVAYANSYPEGRVIKHQEWITGASKLHYKLSTSKQHLTDKIKNSSQDEREVVLLRPFVESADTNYDNRHLLRTTIKSIFPMQISGFYLESEPQIFEVRRQICVFPTNDNSTDQFNCFNSKDLVSVASDINNSIDVDIDLYNLTPGKYITEVQMYVEQIVPSSPMPISFSTLGNNITFTVQSNPKV